MADTDREEHSKAALRTELIAVLEPAFECTSPQALIYRSRSAAASRNRTQNGRVSIVALIAKTRPQAALVLADGTVFQGESTGAAAISLHTRTALHSTKQSSDLQNNCLLALLHV